MYLRMKKLLFLIQIFLLFSLLTYSQVNKYGSAFMNYFPSNAYKGDPRNYAILKNKVDGNLYVANATSGVMVYDGWNWRHLYLNNRSAVYSLGEDNGIVYVGGVDEFGYIDKTKDGGLEYVSLSDSIVKELKLKNSNVWKIYTVNDEVYFCFMRHIVVYDVKKGNFTKVYKLPKGNFWSFVLDKNTIYSSNYLEGLLKVKGDTFVSAPRGEFFKGTDIFSIVTFSEDSLLITYRRYYKEDGVDRVKNVLVVYNTKTGKFRKLRLKTLNGIDLTFKTEHLFVYDLKKIDENYFVISTLSNGAYVFDRNGILYEEFSKRTGLADDLVTSSFVNKGVDDLGVWLSLNNGISKVNAFLPVRKLDKEYGVNDVLQRTFIFDGKLYLISMPSFGYLDLSNELPVYNPVNISTLKNAVLYYVTPYNFNKKGMLISYVAGAAGLLDYDGKNFKIITNDYVTNLIYQSTTDSSVFYLGHEKGVAVLNYNNGEWSFDEPFKFLDNNYIYHIKQTGNYLWVSSVGNGFYKINLKNNKFIHYEPDKNGLPVSAKFYVESFGGEILVGTDVGLYKYNKETDYFSSYDLLPGKGFGNNKVDYIVSIDSVLWLVSNGKINRLSYVGDTLKDLDKVFKILPEMAINNIYEKNGVAYIAGNKGFYSVIVSPDVYMKNFFDNNPSFDVYPLVNVTLMNVDSVIFKGGFYNEIIKGNDTIRIPVLTQPDEMKFVLPFKFRNISFNFSCPYFTGKVEYSFYLDGFSDSWSKWTTNPRAVFTNLKEGDYVLKVKARNIFGKESNTAEFKFTILSPWYRTVWAYIIYIIVIIFIIYLILKFYTRKLERDKKRLEEIVRQRTAEIAKKNEQLQELVDEVTEQKKIIEEKNKDITDSIKYAEQIQVAVLPSQWEDLKGKIELFIYFKPKDIVSGDFYFVKYLQPKDIFVAAAVDCTGHGVPGAFMSLLGVTFLNDILNKDHLYHSNEILDGLREKVISALNQESGDDEKKKDGMDIALIEYFIKENRLEFSGANNPLYLLRDRNLEAPENYSKNFDEEVNHYVLYEFRADRQPIGYTFNMQPFTRYDIKIKSGDIFYMFSDGFADQFGGKKGKKYTYKRFKRLFVSIADLPMEEQRKRLLEESNNWINQSDEEQIDDQLVIGIRFL